MVKSSIVNPLNFIVTPISTILSYFKKTIIKDEDNLKELRSLKIGDYLKKIRQPNNKDRYQKYPNNAHLKVENGSQQVIIKLIQFIATAITY